MFRKSYRRLLRWNDEFPFAKFSVADDERPLLAVEIPIAEADADALGLALARILGIADRLLDESKDWLWLGGRMPDTGDRTSANAALLDRYTARLPELLEAEVELPEPADADADDAETPAEPVPTRGRLVTRRLGLLLLAVVAATGLLATPAGTSEVRAATPDLTIVSNARYDVQPDAAPRPGHRRPGPDQPPAGTRATKRYYFDRAFLAVQPGTSGFKLTSNGAGSARAVVSKKTATYTLLQLNLGRRIYSGKTNDVPARLRPRRQGRRGRSRRPGRRFARLVPGLGVRHRLDPRQHGQGHLPGRLPGRGRSRARSRRRRRRPTGRSHSRPASSTSR